MNRHSWIIPLGLLSLGMLASTPQVFAGESGAPSRESVERVRLGSPWLFFGLDLGTNSVGSVPASEISKSGYHFGLKGIGAFYKPQWVFDVGGGYFADNISGERGNTKVRVITNGGFLEGSARYRLDRDWSIGPVVNVLFSSDTSFSENATDSSSANLMAGLRAQVEIPVQGFILRLGAQALTDVTIGNRQSWMLQGDAQFGFPLFFSEAAPAYGYGPAQASAGEGTVVVILDERIILFETDKYEIRPQYRAKLSQFAHLLAANQPGWDALRVEGHTDIRGSRKHNIELSFNRASSVGQFLIAAGVPTARVEVKGFGPDQPVDPANNEAAWLKNRRVEIRITGVRDTVRMSREINEIWPELR